MATIYGFLTDSLINADDGVTEGADTIVGDETAERIYGLGGDDMLKGGGGADRLYGGDGNDRIEIASGGEFIDGGSGNDTAYFNIEGRHLIGVRVDLSSGHFGSALGPGPRRDDPQNLLNIENVSGSEQLDRIFGNDGDNMLWGNGGSDLLDGRGGDDYLDGGRGDDTIDGGTGDDILAGGADADRFDFQRHDSAMDFGHDVITDFERGLDKILVDDTVSYAAIRDAMRQVGDDVVITFDADNSITLEDYRIGYLSSADFLFV